MWGLGFILLLGIYALFVKGVSSQLSTNRKLIFIFLSIVVPMFSPFGFILSPSYSQFQSLCEQEDRLLINKTVEVDIVKVDRGCYSGVLALKNHDYKGIVCEEWGKSNMYRESENWDSEQCQRGCPTYELASYNDQKECVKNCLEKFPDNSEPFTYIDYEYEFKRSPLIKNKLIKKEVLLNTENYGTVAKSTDYLYYQYGNGIAKILGLSSGAAPSMTCNEKKSFDIHEIFPAKK